MPKPTMFIGSSSEGKATAEYLQAALEAHCDSDVWDQHFFEPSGETLGRLLVAAESYDFSTFVLTADDLIERRGARGSAPRDNVILELGIFLGSLGRDRVFILTNSTSPLAMPTDLLGVTVLHYQNRDRRPNPRAQINPSALKIREVLERLGLRGQDRAAPARIADLLRFACDLTGSFSDGSAGLEIRARDEERRGDWRKNLLGMLAQLFTPRNDDAYVVWLKPDGNDDLRLHLAQNLPDEVEYRSFHRYEGMAGKTWSHGVAAAHTRDEPHNWWAFREGCENKSYVCAPVGPAGSTGGVLAVGSNGGFQLESGDIETVQLFASILAASLTNTGNEVEVKLLKQRASALDSALSNFPASRSAGSSEVRVHNVIVQVAARLFPEDPIIGVMESFDPNDTVQCGMIRMNLALVLATS